MPQNLLETLKDMSKNQGLKPVLGTYLYIVVHHIFYYTHPVEILNNRAWLTMIKWLVFFFKFCPNCFCGMMNRQR